MSNVIAIIWDFDKTLIDGYMEDPIFEEYNIDSHTFWEETNLLPQKYKKEQHVKVNPDTIYLNQMIRYTKNGKFKGLSNQKLRTYGERLKYYKGVPEIFRITQQIIETNKEYQLYDIKLEHYIVSTGLTEIIKGSKVALFNPTP